MKQYQGWRKAHDLPEESPDFSDRDVFDLVFHLIEKARGALVRISEGEENVNL
ncbi:MAG: hypothetical protein JXR97_11720 [Planctomycetes bacterium]|nr:hypothetical protein [Planctomycetota bacterium]